MKAFLLLILCGLVLTAHADNEVLTTDGKTYRNCSLLEVRPFSVIMLSDGKVIEITADRLQLEDRAKVAARMKEAQRLEAEAKAQASEASGRNQELKQAEINARTGRVEVTTKDGRGYKGVMGIEIEANANGTFVKFEHIGGIGRERYEDLSQDWQTRLKKQFDAANESRGGSEWDRNVKAQQKVLPSLTGRVTATLQGAHSEGVRAVLTIKQRIAGKQVDTHPDVIIKGLPAGKTTGTWTGKIIPGTVYEDRKKSEIFPVVWVN